MSLIAEVSLVCPDDELQAALSVGGGMYGLVEDIVVTDGRQTTFFLWVNGRWFDRFQRELARSKNVESVRCLEGKHAGDDRLFRVVAERDPSVYHTYANHSASFVNASVSPDGWRYRLRFPDRDALTSFREDCLDADIEFSLKGLAEGTSEIVAVDVTEPQREALEAALDCGYFQIPRETSLAGVAERIGISQQATSERLRRAEAAAAERLLDGLDEDRKRGP